MSDWIARVAVVRPMLASTGTAPLHSADFVYEPKYDGVRALVAIDDRKVKLWSRLGNDKTSQFPEIAAALRDLSARVGRRLLLDGELVALDAHGEPVGFQHLQGRIHLHAPDEVAHDTEVALIVFDLLHDGDEDLCKRPLAERRARLVQRLDGVTSARVRLSEQIASDGRALHERAQRLGWEGLLAKRASAPYRAGKRSSDWVKLKLVRHQTCVVAGWTEPRGSRPFFGALLLGVYDAAGALQYIGHTGAGFADAELGRVWKRLQALQVKDCPFERVPRTNERPHWVRPRLVAEVKFTEWTTDDKLRHPTYLGLRDDVKAEGVRREPTPTPPSTATTAAPDVDDAPRVRTMPRASTAKSRRAASTTASPGRLTSASIKKLLAQLDEIESERQGSGVVELPGGDTLEVSNLRKTFWPAAKLSKGDLLRHYVRVAPFVLPIVHDRPLVMKRFPNGVSGKPFYQHRAPDKVPSGVRVETIVTDEERRAHLVGGSLKTLLYTAQLGSISQDPWLSRIGTDDRIDHVTLDLDPPDGLAFTRVLDVARWIHDELDALGARAFAKTSGAGGFHIYVPMPPETPYGAGLLFAQIVSTLVANKHPKLATVERALAARGRRVYIDALQNMRGKTLASAYSARASDFAGVSAPVTWQEVEDGVSPKDFTVRNFAQRIEQVGDLWGGLKKAKGANLRALDAITKS